MEYKETKIWHNTFYIYLPLLHYFITAWTFYWTTERKTVVTWLVYVKCQNRFSWVKQ